MTMLILARDINPSADLVVEALGERGVPVFRTDLAAFPQALTVDARLGLHGWEGVQITNKPDAVRDFAHGVNGALAGKTLAASLRIESSRLQMAYTRRIELAELDDLAGVDVTAHLFQRFVHPKAFEARVTVVGTRVFATAIHACSEAARVDWRADYDALDYAAIEPPEPVTAGILAFLKYFGLSFSAFDFVITSNQEWIMLECNPTGAYGWLEEALNLPITSALADLLTSGDRLC
ncbi:MAG: hypothetical protein ACRDQ4_24445 [Pseudonocardiaceae bacterium]